jgi:RNA polymerase sigma-70 factor, ECF subfamily
VEGPRLAAVTLPNDFEGLLQAAQLGDEEAFAAIWRAYQPGVYRYLRVIANGSAEDLAAETWLQVATNLVTFHGDETSFRAWLYTIARNRHVDWCRRVARRPETLVGLEVLDHPSPRDDPAHALEARMSTDAALALIATLPPDQAEAVMLRTVGGLEVAAVARIMDRSPGAVRVLCHRGLQRLAHRLQGLDSPAHRSLTPEVVV